MIPSSRTISSMSSNTCGFSIVGVICRIEINIIKIMVGTMLRLERSMANTGVVDPQKKRLFLGGNVSRDTSCHVMSRAHLCHA